MERIYCPININQNHWTLIVIYIQEKKICYYDSLVRMGSKQAKRYLNGVRLWIQNEAKASKSPDFDIKQWRTVLSPADLPQQSDSCSCGVFVSAFAALLTDDIPLDKFSQDVEDVFRKKLCLDILNMKIGLPDNDNLEVACLPVSSTNSSTENSDMVSSQSDLQHYDPTSPRRESVITTQLLTKNVSSFEGSETHYNPSSLRSPRRDSVITNGASPYKLDQSTPGPTTPHMFSGNPTVNQSTSSLIYGNPTADQSEDPATAPTRKRSSAHATNSLITSGTPTDQTKNKRRQTDLYTFLKK